MSMPRYLMPVASLNRNAAAKHAFEKARALDDLPAVQLPEEYPCVRIWGIYLRASTAGEPRCYVLAVIDWNLNASFRAIMFYVSLFRFRVMILALSHMLRHGCIGIM